MAVICPACCWRVRERAEVNSHLLDSWDRLSWKKVQRLDKQGNVRLETEVRACMAKELSASTTMVPRARRASRARVLLRVFLAVGDRSRRRSTRILKRIVNTVVVLWKISSAYLHVSRHWIALQRLTSSYTVFTCSNRFGGLNSGTWQWGCTLVEISATKTVFRVAVLTRQVKGLVKKRSNAIAKRETMTWHCRN